MVTGITGLLGRYLLGTCDKSVEIHGISRGGWPQSLSDKCQNHEVDLTDLNAVERILNQVKPDVIVHAAAEGRVDIVQANPDEYRPLNVLASENLAILAVRQGIQYVFISSNAVFGGDGSCYSDNAILDPVNQYGILKAEAEKAVLHSNPNALVIRPLLMYGWPMPEQRLNPVVGWVNHLRKGERISVVDDVWSEPLAAWDCARAIWRGLEVGASGPINVSGGMRMSLYEFARLTSSVFNLNSNLVFPISSESLPGVAPRPKDTTFDLVRLTTELGIEPDDPARGLLRLRETESSSQIANT